MRDSDSYFSSPLAPIKCSTKKKAHKNYEPRDSLNHRYKLGKPGSRNYRAWESEFSLRKSHSESESSFSEPEDTSFDEAFEPAFGLFAQFFIDGQVVEDLVPFLDITEHEQNIQAPKDVKKKK